MYDLLINLRVVLISLSFYAAVFGRPHTPAHRIFHPLACHTAYPMGRNSCGGSLLVLALVPIRYILPVVAV